MLGELLALSLWLSPVSVAAVEADPLSRWDELLAERPRALALLPRETLDTATPSLWTRELRLADSRWRPDAPDVATMTGPDWAGLARDTAFLFGYQVVMTGILYVLPEDVTDWSDREKSRGFDAWIDNVSHPTFDGDSWGINYLVHPYFGAAYYIRARERGFGRWSSFAYSALASAMYEFGVEAFFEEPSIQDLIVTPVAGSLLGALVFEPIRARIRAKADLAWYDHVGLVVTDPLGTLNGALERLLGIKSDVRVTVKPPIAPGRGRALDIRDRAIGVEFSIPLR
jgi:hypothetical protein